MAIEHQFAAAKDAAEPSLFTAGMETRASASTARGRLPRRLHPREAPLGRLGSLEVRLAAAAAEIRAAQALRYRVFYGEMSARADARTRLLRRDEDAFDRVCDHLIVVDHDGSPSRLRGGPEVVGTYRLLRQPAAEMHGGFYTADKFTIGALLARHPGKRFLELGRSCVLEPYRNKRTIELLWRGIWAYAQRHGIDVMIGCASLEGVDPERLALPLGFLLQHARAPEEWRVRPLAEWAAGTTGPASHPIDPRLGWRALPPLIKGYLRLGAYVSDGAVVDRQFGTTDVCIVLPVANIDERYRDHFGRPADRFGD